MIRKYRDGDLETILDIWLNESIVAHDFVPAAFWQSQLTNMRTLYLPMSEIYVFDKESEVIGFYALFETSLAAIFVANKWQGQGIGKQLLNHAKAQRAGLSLTVYQQNQASYQFYLSQGFTVVGEQVDEHTGCAEFVMSLN